MLGQHRRARGQGLGQHTVGTLEQVVGKVPGGGCTAAEAEEIEHQVADFYARIRIEQLAQLLKHPCGALLDAGQHTRTAQTGNQAK
ncbi:hypothetical protein D3C75_900960 [compost metagenome]